MSSKVADNQLSVLRQRQKTSLQLCEQKIQQWTIFCSEYSALNERLQTITDTTRHSVIIPVVQSNSCRPPIALLSAYLHHTNEILVLLGDNWFVERSAKEAISIVQRRLKQCQITVDKLKEEKKQIESWMSFTNQLIDEKSDFVEIVEEFDENEELKWKEKHKQNVQKYNKQQAELRKTNKLGPTSTQNCELVAATDNVVINCENEANLGGISCVPVLKSILKDKHNESVAGISEEPKDSSNAIGVTTDSTAKSFNESLAADSCESFQRPFSGKVVERIEIASNENEKQTHPSSKKVSKFKKERQK